MPVVTKKAAICFSGQARTLDRCHEYIKRNVLDTIWDMGLDYDIFCCTEDDDDAYKVDKYLHPVVQKKLRSKDIENLIKDKYWVLLERNYKDFIYPWTTRFNLVTFLQQFYKYKMVNDLKNSFAEANNIEYQYVIRMRFDTLFVDQLNFQEIENGFRARNIFVVDDTLKQAWEMNDMFAIGDKYTMDVYFSIFENFQEIIKLFSISPTFTQEIIFKIEILYVRCYWYILKILEYINTPKIIIDNIFKIFWLVQWGILRKYKNQHSVYQEKLLYKILLSHGISIQKIKLNLFLVRDNRFLNIFISKD